MYVRLLIHPLTKPGQRKKCKKRKGSPYTLRGSKEGRGLFDFKEFVRGLRASTGDTQKEFARKIGVSRSTVSLYESGEQEPWPESMYAMERLAGLPGQYLIARAAFNDMERSGIDFARHLRDPEFLRCYGIVGMRLGNEDTDANLAAVMAKERRYSDLAKWAMDKALSSNDASRRLGDPAPAVAADAQNRR